MRRAAPRQGRTRRSRSGERAAPAYCAATPPREPRVVPPYLTSLRRRRPLQPIVPVGFRRPLPPPPQPLVIIISVANWFFASRTFAAVKLCSLFEHTRPLVYSPPSNMTRGHSKKVSSPAQRGEGGEVNSKTGALNIRRRALGTRPQPLP